MKRIALTFVLLFVAGVASAAADKTDITVDSVLAYMNANRAEAGLAPLHVSSRISEAAGDRMKDMEEQSYWAHISPDGTSPFVWLRSRGYQFANAGENLATGFETAELLVQSWMESKGHRDNIMSPLYQDCGIAIIEGSTTGRSQGKSVVVLFGRPLAQYVSK
jgi:uncharacterized protein YkwD